MKCPVEVSYIEQDPFELFHAERIYFRDLYGLENHGEG